MRMRYLFFLLLVFLSVVAPACAQVANDWRISVLTFGPGPLIFERYGHCAIRLRNPSAGVDVCYDWGNFDFAEPNFIPHFLLGRLNYSMEGKDTARVLAAYIDDADRAVTEQLLNLDPAQVARVIDRIRSQDDDVHRYYLYDYFRDNCSTRVRDALDEATDGALRRSMARPVSQTYRWHNRRVSPVGATNRLLCVLMDFALGPRVDLPLERWDETFIPTTLADALDEVRLTDQAGERPLVRERRTLHLASAPANFEPVAPPPLALWTLPVGLAGGALLVLLARWQSGIFRFSVTVLSSLLGVGGVFLIALWAFTQHWPAGWNENVLQFTPLSLVMAVAVWPRRMQRLALRIAFIILGLSALGALATLMQLAVQRNAPAVCLALPLHAAIWFGLRHLSKGSAHAPELASVPAAAA